MRLSPLKRIFAGASLLAACFAASTVAAGDAQAQTTTGPTVTVSGIVTRDGPDHPPNIAANVINYADCLANETIHIPLTITGIAAGNTLEAWAGEGTVDCTNVTNRTAATAQCWQVESGINGSVQTTSADLRAWDIISQFGATTKVPTGQINTGAVCNSSTISAGPHTITISFFFTNGVNGVGTGATYTITAAMQAAALNGTLGLSDPGAGAGDGLVKVTLPNSSDLSIQGYQFYCDPAPSAGAAGSATDATTDTTPVGTTVGDSSLIPPSCNGSVGTPDSGASPEDAGDDASDGGDASDASSDSGDSSAPIVDASTSDACGLPINATPSSEAGTQTACTSSVLIPGSTTNSEGGVTSTVVRPPPDPIYKCGSSAATSSTVTISGLTNGVNYKIAAAASDIYGNVGPLSALVCATPQPIDDFWNVYGGPAGGGFCALEGAGMPAGAAAFAGAMLVAAIGLVRRRRRS